MRIRPNLGTFRSETQTGVRSAIGGVAKSVATIAGVAGGIRFFESAIKDAAEEQRALAALRQSVVSVGAAYTINGKSLDEILQKMEVATGVGLPELAQGFLRLVTQTKSSRVALRDLGLAEDVALARHLRLAQSAVILARAEGGSATALRRLGIIIPAVTAHSAALTREHERAKAAGVEFTASQELAYKAALAQAGALDKQASKTRIISEIQRRFGGQTEVFAKTAQGEAARFHESVKNILEDVGNVLLPGLSAGAERADVLVERLRDSEGFDHALSSGFHAIGEAGHVAAEGIALVAPVLTVAAHAAADVLSFTGTGGLLAFAAGWKAVGIGTSVAAGAERRYQAVLAAGRGQRAAQVTQEEAAATAQAAHTAALAANTEALVVNRLALGSRVAAGAGLAEADLAAITATSGFTAATEREAAALVASRAALLANVAATEAFALSRVSAGGVLLPSGVAAAGLTRDAAAMGRTGAAATGLAARVGVLGRGLLALGGGWTTVAALGLGGLAFGIYKLVTADSALERANRHLGESFQTLAEDVRASQKLARDYSETQSSIRSDRIAVQTARTNVALAEQSLRTTTASRTSLEYRQLVDQLATSEDAYRVAVRTLARDEAQASQQRSSIAQKDAKVERGRADAIRETVAAAREARQQEQRNLVVVAHRLPPSEEEHQRDLVEAGRNAARDFADAREEEAASVARTNAPLARRIKLLADFARAAGRIPTKREVEVAISAPDFRAAVGALVGALGRIRDKTVTVSFRTQELHGGITEGALGASKAEDKALRGIAESSRAAAGLVSDVARSEMNEARNTVAAAKSTLSKLSQQIADARQGAKDASDAVEGTEQEIADANRGVREAGREVRDAQQGVADAIRQGAQTVRDAVAQADQNLFSIGSSLADVIDKFLDAQKDSASALTGPEARRIKELRAQILAGQGGPETRKAAQELAAELEARQAKGSGDLDKRKERIRREIADLIDEFNKGEINLRAFNRRVARLLEREHVSYRAAGKVLGEAFADGFRAEVRGLLAQAKALASSRRPGVTGLEPTVVRPLEAIKQSQREIAAAQQRRDDASYALAQAGRRVQDAQERHEQAIASEARAEHKLVSLVERRERIVSVERRAEERLQSLQEQHLRFIRQQAAIANRHLRAIQAAAEHRPPPRAAAPAPGRGGPDRPGFAAGGVAGTHGPPPGGRDTVPAWLTPNEVVFADRHQPVLARALGVRDDPHVIFRAVDSIARGGVAHPDGRPARAFAGGGVAWLLAPSTSGGKVRPRLQVGEDLGEAIHREVSRPRLDLDAPAGRTFDRVERDLAHTVRMRREPLLRALPRLVRADVSPILHDADRVPVPLGDPHSHGGRGMIEEAHRLDLASALSREAIRQAGERERPLGDDRSALQRFVREADHVDGPHTAGAYYAAVAGGLGAEIAARASRSPQDARRVPNSVGTASALGTPQRPGERLLGASSPLGATAARVMALARGYEGWIRRPTVALLGEGGEDEFVSVTPRSKLPLASRRQLVEPLDLAPLDAGRPQPGLRPGGGDRRVVGELQDLAELEERLATKLLAESRRQTAELRRIHEAQRTTARPGTATGPRPGNEASRNARLATMIG